MRVRRPTGQALAHDYNTAFFNFTVSLIHEKVLGIIIWKKLPFVDITHTYAAYVRYTV